MIAQLKRRIEELERIVKRLQIIQTAQIQVSETTNGTILNVRIADKKSTTNTTTTTNATIPRWL